MTELRRFESHKTLLLFFGITFGVVLMLGMLIVAVRAGENEASGIEVPATTVTSPSSQPNVQPGDPGTGAGDGASGATGGSAAGGGTSGFDPANPGASAGSSGSPFVTFPPSDPNTPVSSDDPPAPTRPRPSPPNDGIDSFEKCAAAGNPIAESYPEQCFTPDGRSFTRVIS